MERIALMARIPIEIATRELDAGPPVHYPAGGGPVGAAVEDLGAGIARLAERVHENRKRHEAFDAALREQEFLDELKRVEGEAIAASLPDGGGLHDSIYAGLGPSGGKRSRFDELFEQHAALVPESQRQAFVSGKEYYRRTGSMRLAEVQFLRRREYEQGALVRVQKGLIASLRTAGPRDGAAFRAARQKGLDVIASMSVDEPARAALAGAWDQNITLAQFESRLRQEPGFAATARGMLDQPGD
jgi:hypothetical protein